MALSKKHYFLIVVMIITVFLSAFGGAYLGSYLSINPMNISNNELSVEEFPDFSAPEDLLDETIIKMESKMTRADKYIDNRTFEIAENTNILLSAELTARNGTYSISLYQKGKIAPVYIDKGKIISINKTIDLEPGTYQIIMIGKNLKDSIYDIRIVKAES